MASGNSDEFELVTQSNFFGLIRDHQHSFYCSKRNVFIRRCYVIYPSILKSFGQMSKLFHVCDCIRSTPKCKLQTNFSCWIRERMERCKQRKSNATCCCVQCLATSSLTASLLVLQLQ